MSKLFYLGSHIHKYILFVMLQFNFQSVFVTAFLRWMTCKKIVSEVEKRPQGMNVQKAYK